MSIARPLAPYGFWWRAEAQASLTDVKSRREYASEDRTQATAGPSLPASGVFRGTRAWKTQIWRTQMQIQYQMEGGLAAIPGLSKPRSIDTDDLPKEEADAIKASVENAHFFDRPQIVGTPKLGAADYRKYTVTVKDGGRSHTVQLTDPVADPALHSLVTHLQDAVRKQGKG